VWGVDAIVLEANHDIEMLRNGPYPYYLQQRILSRYGHLSNVDCGQFAASLADTGTKRIVLAHLSEQNNTPEKAYSQVKRALADADVELTVAPRSEAGEVYII
jgi:phosphoribosyl 1,2-cyclic phosphodiesterase